MRTDYRSRWQQKRRVRASRERLIAIGVALALALVIALVSILGPARSPAAGYNFLRPAISWLAATNDGVLVSARSGTLIKLTPDLEPVETGWSHPFMHPAGFWGRPAVAEGHVLIGCGDVRLRAVDVASGLQTWEVRAGSSVPGVTADGDRAYFASSSGVIHAVTAEGAVLWEAQVGGEVASAPLVRQETVLVGTLNGRVCCLDRATGELLWSVGVGAPVYASPRRGPSHILVGDDLGELHSITREGELLTSLQLEGLIRHPAGIREAVVVVGDSSGLVVRVNPADMSEMWRAQLRGPLAAEPIVTGDAVWCAAGRRLVKLSVEDGSVLSTRVAEAQTSDCIAAHGRIYWATSDGRIRAVPLESQE